VIRPHALLLEPWLFNMTKVFADPNVSRHMCQLGNVCRYEIHLGIRSPERCDWASMLVLRSASTAAQTFSFRDSTEEQTRLDDMKAESCWLAYTDSLDRAGHGTQALKTQHIIICENRALFYDSGSTERSRVVRWCQCVFGPRRTKGALKI
jgi:hypothetical protein